MKMPIPKIMLQVPVLTLVTLLMTQLSFAQSDGLGQAGQSGHSRTYLNELTGGTNSTISFGGGSTSVGISAGYKFYMLPDYGVQIGVDTTYSYLSANDIGTTDWPVFFGARYNFLQLDPNQLNQFFVELGAGFSYRRVSGPGDTANSTTKFTYGGSVGKRFELFANLAYVPEIRIRKVADETVRFTFVPIAFSFFF